MKKTLMILGLMAIAIQAGFATTGYLPFPDCLPCAAVTVVDEPIGQIPPP